VGVPTLDHALFEYCKDPTT